MTTYQVTFPSGIQRLFDTYEEAQQFATVGYGTVYAIPEIRL